ncbi:hypothetical protein KUTeg_024365 [Tegillarca granosa]|uniref:Uncharacterized protein n=1 Tax=Tegillarca granosa TaxID=220873 RepID=A0ABQ9DXN9_TEGGR|nr:hypothetical protein KUTeg_024365 [Tegillarca granosa]
MHIKALKSLYMVIYVLELINVAESTYCKPGRKRYNPVIKRCQRCPDNCPNGQTMNTSSLLNISKDFGALDCYPCVQCPDGKYSNVDTQGICLECDNCAKMENKTTSSECDGKRNAKCGECLPMFYEIKVAIGFSYCVKCSKSSVNEPNCAKISSKIQSTTTHQTTTDASPEYTGNVFNKMSPGVPILSTTKHQTTTVPSPGYIGHILNHMNVSVLIIVIMVCIAVFFGLVFAIYKISKCVRKTCFSERENFGTYSTVALDSSTSEGLKSSENVSEDQNLPLRGLETDGSTADETLTDTEKNTMLLREDEFLRLGSRFIDKPIWRLYISLDIDGGKQHELSTKYGAEPMEEKLQALAYWVGREGANATFGRLYDALMNARCNLACEKLLEALRKKAKV